MKIVPLLLIGKVHVWNISYRTRVVTRPRPAFSPSTSFDRDFHYFLVRFLMKWLETINSLDFELHFQYKRSIKILSPKRVKSRITYHKNSSQEPSMSPYCHRLHSQIQALDRSTWHSVEQFETAQCRLLFCPKKSFTHTSKNSLFVV